MERCEGKSCSLCQRPVLFATILRDGRLMCGGCKAVEFFKRHLTLTADYAGKPFIPMPWVSQVLYDLFGTFDDDGLYTYRDVYLEVPKKNTKTTFCAGLCLMAVATCTNTGAEVYSAATSKDQASILFRAAHQMILNSPSLSAKFVVLPSVKKIIKRSDPTSFYQAISADGDVHDGIQPVLAIRDELHRWRTRKQLELNEVLERGMISRLQMRVIDITTAGECDASPLAWRRHEYTEQIRKKVFTDQRFYGRIWAANLRTKANPNGVEWDSKEARIQANPSHEANGGYLKDSVLEDLCVKARNDPQSKSDYLRYHLNVWSQRAEAAIDLDKWDENQGGIDLQSWPEFDVDYLIRRWGLMERPCAIGIDCSWTIDLASMVCIFPPDDEDGLYALLPFFWIPSETALAKERKDKVPYRLWVERGFITESLGRANDARDVAAKVKWACEMFDVSSIAFDPWNFRQTANEMTEEGLPMKDIPQNMGQLTGPTKQLLGLIENAKLAHGNHPVLRWNASCLSLQGDKKDNVMPAKPERAKSSKRVDGISAIITGLKPLEQSRPSATPQVIFI